MPLAGRFPQEIVTSGNGWERRRPVPPLVRCRPSFRSRARKLAEEILSEPDGSGQCEPRAIFADQEKPG